MKDRILCMGMQVDPRCVLCRAGSETTTHLFGDCIFAKQVLQDVVLTGSWADYSQGSFFIRNDISKARKHLAYLFLSAAVHSLWRERNDRIHTVGHGSSPYQICAKVLSMVRDSTYLVSLLC